MKCQSTFESETVSERAEISTPVICFPPSFIFSKREAPTTVNSARSLSGPETESDKSCYFGTCFRWETIGEIVPTLPRPRCLPLKHSRRTTHLEELGAKRLLFRTETGRRRSSAARKRRDECRHVPASTSVLWKRFSVRTSTASLGEPGALVVLVIWLLCVSSVTGTGACTRTDRQAG